MFAYKFISCARQIALLPRGGGGGVHTSNAWVERELQATNQKKTPSACPFSEDDTYAGRARESEVNRRNVICLSEMLFTLDLVHLLKSIYLVITAGKALFVAL